MFKELLRVVKDLGLGFIMLRGVTDNGEVEDMTIREYEDMYGLLYQEPHRKEETFIGFTLEDRVVLGESYIEIDSNGIKRFYREFPGGIGIRLPYSEETIELLISSKIKGFTLSTYSNLDIAYFDIKPRSKVKPKFYIKDSKITVDYEDNHFEIFVPDNPEIRIYSLN